MKDGGSEKNIASLALLSSLRDGPSLMDRRRLSSDEHCSALLCRTFGSGCKGIQTAGGAAENKHLTLARCKTKTKSFPETKMSVQKLSLDSSGVFWFLRLKHFYELIEKVECICWAGGGFGVKLAGEKGKGFVFNPFDCVVVGVAEPNFPAWFKGFFINGEAMILTGDVAAFGVFIYAWLVLAAVSEFQFISFCA